MKEHDIVKPSETKTFFQSQDWPLHGQIPVGTEFQIEVVGNPQQKLFFDNLRGMLSVDEKLRKRTSRDKQSVLVGKVIEEISEEGTLKIYIYTKASNTGFDVLNYLKLDYCRINCEDSEFSMGKDIHIFEIEYVTPYN